MSSYYNMCVEIWRHDADKTTAIKDAAKGEWDFDDWNECEGALSARADGDLCAETTEEQFAERLTKAIWRVNGKFCNVLISATYLEDLPIETYSLDEDEFERFKTEIDNMDSAQSRAVLAAAKPK